MFDWKKLANNLIKVGTDKVSEIKKSVDSKFEVSNKFIMENDTLKAIDELTDSRETTEGAGNITKVPVVGTWSNFDYVHKPDMWGLGDLIEDNKVYFTIPIGWNYDEDMEIQYWYLTFPLDGSYDDVIEFYSPIKIDEVKFPGADQ